MIATDNRFDCNNSTQENWQIGDSGPGYTQITIAGSDFCLDAGNTDSSNDVVISECNQGPSQQWTYTHISQLQLLDNPKLCLELPNFSTDDDNQVKTYPCNGGINQAWKLLNVTN